MDLTETRFWENYWRNCPLPNVVDQNFSFDRCLSRGLKQYLPQLQGEIFEIGCAPGRWLAHLAKEYGVKPNGIEYSEAGMRATLHNFEMLGIDGGEIRAGDFFAAEPEARFDAVLSLGFIEHFSDPDAVVARHLAWLKPGGVLVLGVPNFRGIYRHLQAVLDPEVLAKHNLEIMAPEYFQHLATKFQLATLHIGYLGSFEPSLPVPSKSRKGLSQLMFRVMLRIGVKLRSRWMDDINHPWFSSYLLAIYRKGGGQ